MHTPALAALMDERPGTIEETAIHIVDAVSSLVGPLQWCGGASRVQDGVRHYRIEAAGTAPVLFDVWPAGGIDQECIECTGDGWRLECRSGWFDSGVVRAWEGKDLVLDERIDPALPMWRRAGMDAEIAAFVAALRDEAAWSPRAAEVLPSARLGAQTAALESCMQ